MDDPLFASIELAWARTPNHSRALERTDTSDSNSDNTDSSDDDGDDGAMAIMRRSASGGHALGLEHVVNMNFMTQLEMELELRVSVAGCTRCREIVNIAF
jgi:hypothetical protein